MNRIQEILDAKGRTQTWLASELKGAVNRQTLNAYCQNQQQPRLDTLAIIASVLGVSVRSLIGDGSEIED